MDRPGRSPSTLKRDFATAEQALERLSREQGELEAQLAGTGDPRELAQAGTRHKQVQQDIALIEAQWLALAEQIEAISG